MENTYSIPAFFIPCPELKSLAASSCRFNQSFPSIILILFYQKNGKKPNVVFPKESGNFLVKNATASAGTGKLSKFFPPLPQGKSGGEKGWGTGQSVYIIFKKVNIKQKTPEKFDFLDMICYNIAEMKNSLKTAENSTVFSPASYYHESRGNSPRYRETPYPLLADGAGISRK